MTGYSMHVPGPRQALRVVDVVSIMERRNEQNHTKIEIELCSGLLYF